MNFGRAIESLKQGEKVAREGWNGKNMWLLLQRVELSPVLRGGATLTVLPWIGMRTANAEWVPWLASQTDMLAEDWDVIA